MDCKKNNNIRSCNCSYEPCPRKGICCQCIEYHRKNRELPACFFDTSSERTYNRSFEYFANLINTNKL